MPLLNECTLTGHNKANANTHLMIERHRIVVWRQDAAHLHIRQEKKREEKSDQWLEQFAECEWVPKVTRLKSNLTPELTRLVIGSEVIDAINVKPVIDWHINDC